MVHFAKISKASPPYSILKHGGRTTAPRSGAKKLSQIIANNIDNGGGGLISEFM